MAAKFVNPNRNFVAVSCGDGVLTVRASRQRGVLGGFGEIRKQRQQVGELRQEYAVDAAQVEQFARLRDVLRGSAPVDIAAGVPFADAVKLPHHRHKRMPRARQALADVVHIQILELCLGRNLFGGVRRYDAQFGLRLRQRHFHVQPRLNARRLPEQRARARIAHPIRRRFCLHSVAS